MVSILFFIIVILIISILCFLSGRRMAENRAEKNQNPENQTKGSRAAQSIKHFLMRHPVMVKGLLLFYIAFAGCFTFSHKKPAISPGFHQGLSADLLLRNHRFGICRPLRGGKREDCLSSDPPYDHSGHGVQICS